MHYFISKITLFFFTCLSISSISCVTNTIEGVEVPNYEATFAIPIINNASLSLRDIWQSNTPNQSLVIAPNGQLVFKYLSPKATVDAEDILGTLSFILAYSLEESGIAVPLDLPIDIDVQEALINGGVLSFQFNTLPSATIEATFIIEEITKDGKSLEIKSNTLLGATLPINLEGYIIRPTNNHLTIRYEAKDGNGQLIPLENVRLIANPKIQFLKAFLGRALYTLPTDIIPLDLFNELSVNGAINFTEPKITAYIDNSFGIPVRSQIDLLRAHLKDASIMDVRYDAIHNQDINYPSIQEIGTSKATELSLNHTNSNLVAIFNNEVTAIEYGISAIINPTNDASIIGFMTDSSTFTAQIAVEVPLIGSVDNFKTSERYDFSIEELENIKEGTFKLIANNELPLEAAIQLYFIKENNFVLDSLFIDGPFFIDGASVDNTGNVVAPSEITTYIPISSEQIQGIQQADLIEISSNFKTTGQAGQAVHLVNNQEITIRLGLEIRLE